MNISFSYDYAPSEFHEFELEGLAEFVLRNEGCPARTEASVNFVTDEEIARLNETYRGVEGPTDVLSFECDGVEDGFDDVDGAESEDFGSAGFDVSEGSDAGAPICPCEGSSARNAQTATDIPFELGDIVIASDVASRQCEQYGNSVREELELLLTHGLLHLCGYDHLVDEEAEQMEARERELLAAWRSR